MYSKKISHPWLKQFYFGKSNGKSQIKCNRNFWHQLSGWISWLLASCILYRVCTYYYYKTVKCIQYIKRSTPLYPRLYGSLYSTLCIWQFHFFTTTVDHDNDAVSHHLSHLNISYEQYKGKYINHRHRVCYCITFLTLYCFIWFILLLEHTCNSSKKIDVWGPQLFTSDF